MEYDSRNPNEVSLTDLPDIIAREEYHRWEEFCGGRYACGTGRSVGEESLTVRMDELPRLIEQEQLRRAYENDRR